MGEGGGGVEVSGFLVFFLENFSTLSNEFLSAPHLDLLLSS